MTVSQFAKALGVSRWAIYLRLKSGTIKHVEHPGKLWFISERELGHWKKKEGKKSRKLERFERLSEIT